MVTDVLCCYVSDFTSAIFGMFDIGKVFGSFNFDKSWMGILYAVEVYAVAEVLFHFYYRYTLHRLNSHCPHDSNEVHLNHTERRELFQRTLGSVSGDRQQLVNFVERWFFGAALHTIHRDNVRELLASVFFLQDYHEMIHKSLNDTNNFS